MDKHERAQQIIREQRERRRLRDMRRIALAAQQKKQAAAK